MVAKSVRQKMSQVVAPGSGNPVIHFLQTEYVCPGSPQDFKNTIRAVAAVVSDRFMYIVCEDVQHDYSSVWTL